MPKVPPQWVVSVLVAIIAIFCLAAAVTLEITGNDATHAWEGFAASVVFFGGVHVPSPTQGQ